MSEDIFTLDDSNNASVRVVLRNAGLTETNKEDIFTKDEDGNSAVRVVQGSGSGGSFDYKTVIVKADTIPTAGADYLGYEYQYFGATNETYTHGYIYECVAGTPVYTGTVSFEAATLSGTTVTCDGDDFANFLTEGGEDPSTIVSGTMTYDAGADGWRLVGKDAEDTTVTTFIEYTEDYTDHGFVFTGTPQDGDVIAFTCTVESTATYAWQRVDVQPTGVISVNGRTGAVTGVQDVATISTVSASTLTQELADNTIYNCGELSTLEITFPATPTARYISQINFTSGTTATSLTAPASVIWSGDDIVSDVFVPDVSKRYSVLFFYDGVSMCGIAKTN